MWSNVKVSVKVDGLCLHCDKGQRPLVPYQVLMTSANTTNGDSYIFFCENSLSSNADQD